MIQHPRHLRLNLYESLFLGLSCTFCVLLVTTNMIAAKIFTVPCIDLALPVGLITYPLTFVITDVIAEVYGPQRARFVVYLGLLMTFLMWAIVQMALALPPDPTWYNAGNPWGFSGWLDYQNAYAAVFQPNNYAVLGSMLAYLVSQLIDIRVFQLLRSWTQGRHLWLRNNASTLLSQLVDTAVVNVVFLYWGMGIAWDVLLPMLGCAYLYKAVFAILDTPLCYLMVRLIQQQLRSTEYRVQS